MAKSVAASGYTDQLFTNRTNMTVDTTGPGSFEANVSQNGSTRSASVASAGFGYFGSDNVTLESNGASARGAIVMDQNTWAIFSNAPGSRLDGSLGPAA